MESKIIGIILWSISATLIPSLFSHITAWLFLSAGLLGGAAAFWSLSRWRLYVIAVCAAYLLYVVPPLVSLSNNGGPFNALGAVTQAVFKEGITAAKLLVYWHLIIMPIAVFLLILFLLFRSVTGARQK